MPGNKEIDDILNAALDELEDDSDDGDSCVDGDGSGDGVDQHKTSTERNKSTPQNDDKTSRPVFGPPRPPSISEEEKAVMDMMHQMENLFPSEDFGIDGNTHVNLNHGHDKKTSEKNNEQEGQESEPDMNDAVTQLLHKLSNNDEINENGGSGNFGGLGDEMTENMMKEFESTMKGIGPSSFGGDEEDGMGDVVDGMMKQLLSKEFMYEPMKDICERFPTWLAENKEKLSPEDYEKHGKQYQYFQKIVHLYVHDPDNTARLTELMNDLQEYGQPPAEIVQELAPGLEFDENGMPKVGDFGGAPIPGMNEECVLM